MIDWLCHTITYVGEYSLQRAQGYVEFKKLRDVVVCDIFWDVCVVKELQVGFVHEEQFSLWKYINT